MRQSHNLFRDACNPFFSAFRFHRRYELGQIRELPADDLNLAKESFRTLMEKNKALITSESEGIEPKHFDMMLALNERCDWANPRDVRVLYGTIRKLGMWKKDEVACPKCLEKTRPKGLLGTTSAAFDDSLNFVHGALMSHEIKASGFVEDISKTNEECRKKFMAKMRQHGKDPHLAPKEGVEAAHFDLLYNMAKGKDWNNPKNVLRVYRKACEIRGTKPRKFKI